MHGSVKIESRESRLIYLPLFILIRQPSVTILPRSDLPLIKFHASKRKLVTAQTMANRVFNHFQSLRLHANTNLFP